MNSEVGFAEDGKKGGQEGAEIRRDGGGREEGGGEFFQVYNFEPYNDSRIQAPLPIRRDGCILPSM